MRRVPMLLACLVMLLTPSMLSAAASDLGVISGVVHDAAGKPLTGATVSLTSHASLASTQKTTSSPVGEYRFSGLAAGEYTLDAALNGYTLAAHPAIHISASLAPVIADLTLNPSPASTTFSEPPGQSDESGQPNESQSHGPLQFQAAGIRGLIDPGGYSASAGSAAASGLLRGIADIKRTDKSSDAAAVKEWPCHLEPELRKAVDKHPDQAEANRKLGQFYVAHDQPAKAIPLLQQAMQLDGWDYIASRNLAVAWLQNGQFKSAHKLLTAMALDRREAEVHQLLARADEGLGMFRQAAEEYRIADRSEPSEESLYGIGYELTVAGSPSEGLDAFKTGEHRYPQSIPLRIGEGTAQFLLGHSAEAVHSLLDATDIDPADSRPYSFLAAASGLTGEESTRVRSSFKRFLDRAPGNASANYFYALALSRQGPDTDTEANAAVIETLLKHAIQLDPHLARAHLQLADLYAKRSVYEQAMPEYEAAVRLDPDLSEAHYRLALAARRAGRNEQSVREMQIFQQAKVRQAAGSGGEGIDIAQFISVMDTPASPETQCAASPR